MMIDWLYRTSLELSLLIGLVLILRPFVRHHLGAHISYWLWLIPVARCFMWDKPELPEVLVEKISMANGDDLLRVFPNPDYFQIPAYIPLDWIWFTGFMFWSVCRIAGWRQLQTYLDQQSKIIELPVNLQGLVNLKKPYKHVDFYITDIPSAPFVTGLSTAKVYLPNAFFSTYSLIQQQCIIKHELTHLRRNDLWSQVLGELIRALFWFNPIVHIAWQAFREDQELACDQTVLRRCNYKERYEYGRALVKGLHSHVLPASLAFFSKKKERFIMLEKHKSSKVSNIIGLGLCAVIGVFALTKAPVAIAQNSAWNDDDITLQFESMPLSVVVDIIADYTKETIKGGELLESISITTRMEGASANQIITALLKCHGYQLVSKDDHYLIQEASNNDGLLGDSTDCLHFELGDNYSDEIEENKVGTEYLGYRYFADDQGDVTYTMEEDFDINVKQAPLDEFVKGSFRLLGLKASGYSLLSDKTITMTLNGAEPLQITSDILNCFGFTLDKDEDHFHIIADQQNHADQQQAQHCLDTLVES